MLLIRRHHGGGRYCVYVGGLEVKGRRGCPGGGVRVVVYCTYLMLSKRRRAMEGRRHYRMQIRASVSVESSAMQRA